MEDISIEDGLKREIITYFDTQEKQFDELLLYFNETLRKEIEKRYLSHLVSSIEDIINTERKNKMLKLIEELDRLNFDKYKSLINGESLRLFSIKLIPIDKSFKIGRVDKVNNVTYHIYYYSSLEDKQKRIVIAHELGHILYNVTGKFYFKNVESFASLFAFIAILDKNIFYRDVAKQEYTYPSDLSIFSEIKFLLDNFLY